MDSFYCFLFHVYNNDFRMETFTPVPLLEKKNNNNEKNLSLENPSEMNPTHATLALE